jgi:hypothetical protein
MTVDPFAATPAARAVVFSGMSVGFAMVFCECHSVSLRRERIAPPRP